MLVFHSSNSLYEKPTHENIIKNRQNHVNGVLGLWFAINPSWIDSFGRNTYEITLDQNDVIVLSENKAKNLFLQVGDIAILYFIDRLKAS